MDVTLLDTTAFKLLGGLLFGPVLGSFLTMLSYRLPRRLSVMGRSACPSCKTTLTPRDLIPLLSWLLSRGHCRHCGAQIGARYFLIELVSTAGVTACFLALGYTLALIPALLAWVGIVTFLTIRMEQRN